jgi:hypothetical protein
MRQHEAELAVGEPRDRIAKGRLGSPHLEGPPGATNSHCANHPAGREQRLGRGRDDMVRRSGGASPLAIVRGRRRCLRVQQGLHGLAHRLKALIAD